MSPGRGSKKSPGRRKAAPAAIAPAAADVDTLVTNPAKVFWPGEDITKGDLVRYYQDIAAVLLPHLRDRPLVMKPYPNGIAGRFYYRQTLPKTAPPWLPRWTHTPRAGAQPNEMPLAQDVAALTWLTNQAAIEMHPWLSRVDAPDQPDYIVLDLDILDPAHFPGLLEASLLVRDAVERRGLTAYPKTTGGDGLHIYVPIRRGPSFDDTRAWALSLAETLRDAHPDVFSTESKLAGRERLILVDYAQNALGKTTVAPYSVRPRPGATVAMPVAWREIEAGRITPADFTIRTAPARIRDQGDLFAPVLEGSQPLQPMP
ncbi:MAG: non-homologous end-joining DNA ligase [Dehalococcoidia bacterium]